MKVPPKKPQFFKPIQPGFKNGIKIPIGFLKYLKGHDEHEHAVLRRAGKKWLVKRNGMRFEDGWEKFAEAYDLQLGDILVFRHEGNMEFEVSIFDSIHCVREYVENMQIKEDEEEEKEETSRKFEFNDKPNPCIVSSRPNAEEAATHNPFGQSHFGFTVKPYCLTNGYLRLPKKFVLANDLLKKCDALLIIRDERQRSWNLRLTAYGSQVYIIGGWVEFRVENDLKVGDHIMFEVVNNGKIPIWRFHDKRNLRSKSLRKSFPRAEAATHKPFGYSHFICTIRPYSLSNDLLCIPRKFARANRLMNKKRDLIIRDERQRSWDLRLGYFGNGVCINAGWHEFRDTNCLKVGDCVMFEVVRDGEKPIWQFSWLNISGEECKHILQGESIEQ